MLLDVADLSVDLPTAGGVRRLVRGVSFALDAGQTLGVVGESGSGKTVTALALMGLLPEGASVSGRAIFEGRDLVGLDEAQMQRLRGDRIAMIFQEPMTALNPLQSVGRQIAEPLILHRGLSRGAAGAEAVRLLARVGLPDPARRARAHPHELSGGQRQRAMIAMALACAPRLIIADEPTTALDVTVQAQILDLIADLCAHSDMALILVSHDLAVVAQNCRRVQVMYGGRILETGTTRDLFYRPLHPYTRALQKSIPAIQPKGAELYTIAGLPPDLSKPLPGCPFAPRCEFAVERCRTEPVTLVPAEPGHDHACLRVAAGEL